MKRTYLSPKVRKFSISPAQVMATSTKGGKSNNSNHYEGTLDDAFWTNSFASGDSDDATSSPAASE